MLKAAAIKFTNAKHVEYESSRKKYTLICMLRAIVTIKMKLAPMITVYLDSTSAVSRG